MQKLISQLIKFQSDKDHPEEIRKCFNFITAYLKKAGLYVKTFSKNGKPSLVATFIPTKTPEIFLNGHLDVVPGSSKQFSPKIIGNRLYGRGALDMKAALATMITLMKTFSPKQKDQLKNKVGLMIASDEEIGGFDGSGYLLKKGYRPKFFLAGEPTDLNIGYQAKGVLWLKLISTGQPAHGARLWLGKNAILEMNSSLNQIRKIFPVPSKESWKTTCNVATIQGGEAINRVPDKCEVKLDIRPLPTENPEKIIKKIKKTVGEVKVETIFNEPAANCSKTNPYIIGLKRSIQKTGNLKPAFIKKHASSDVRHFSSAGIPGIVFGPIGKGEHSDHEWIDLKSLKLYSQILKSFLLCS